MLYADIIHSNRSLLYKALDLKEEKITITVIGENG